MKEIDRRSQEAQLVQLVKSDGTYPAQYSKSVVTKCKEQTVLLARLFRENEEQIQAIITSLNGEVALSHINLVEPTEHSLHYERKHRQELETRCINLSNEMDFVKYENDTLRFQNKKSRAEVQTMRGTKQLQSIPATSDDSVNSHDDIRSHAEKLLDWADKAIQNGRKATHSECGSSWTKESSMGTDLRPSSPKPISDRYDLSNAILDDKDNNALFDFMQNGSNAFPSSCPCHGSTLASNSAHVNFFLPNLGIMCCCGRKEEIELRNPDPSHLANILRDWQVEFLGSMDITTAAKLILAYNNGKTSQVHIAKQMRLWRKQKRLLSVKTKSCSIALRIWSRTCAAVLKAMDENDDTMSGRPDFLDVSFSSATVSSLGFGESVSDANQSRDDDDNDGL